MTPEDSSTPPGADLKSAAISYALRLGEGLEFAEFEPSLWRLTVYHVLGVSRQVSLGYAEVFLLDYFAQHPGEMISRQQLLDHAWGDRVVSQGSLNQAISNLRAILGDDQRREIILTVPRRGYQFNADSLVDWDEWLQRKDEIVNPAALDTQPRDIPTPPLVPVRAVSSQRNWHSLAVLGAVVGMSLSLVAGLFANYYYTVFPPYTSGQVTTNKLQATLVAKDKEELDATHQVLLPTLKRMEALGSGRTLISRTNNYLEFNCFRADGSVRTLLVHIGRLQSVDDVYLQECLK